MCFDLNMAAEVPIPTIEPKWGEGIWTDEIDPTHPVNHVFSLPYRKYIGSFGGCSCYFQYADWSEEQILDPATYKPIYGEGPELHIDYGGSIRVEILEKEVNPNHRELVELIHGLLRESKRVELFGCWERQWAEPILKRVEIQPKTLLENDFFFYEHYLYNVSYDA